MDFISSPGSIKPLPEQSSDLLGSEDSSGVDDDDPYSLNRTSSTLIGLIIAVASIGVPLSVVFTERPFSSEKEIVPNALEPNGSKSSPSITFSRFGKPSS